MKMKIEGLVIKTADSGEMEDVANAIGNAAIMMSRVIETMKDIGNDVGDLDRQLEMVLKIEDLLFKLAERNNTLNKLNGISRAVVAFLMEHSDSAFTLIGLSHEMAISQLHMRMILKRLVEQRYIEARTVHFERPISSTFYSWSE